jgi:hypothetical protein
MIRSLTLAHSPLVHQSSGPKRIPDCGVRRVRCFLTPVEGLIEIALTADVTAAAAAVQVAVVLERDQ